MWLLRKQKKKKAELIALLTQITKGRSSGVVLVVRSSLADTIPNAVGYNFRQILLGSAPAKLVRMVSPTSNPWGSALLVSLKALFM